MVQAGWLYAHRDDLTQIYAVRETVFAQEQGFDANIDQDDYDQAAGHAYVKNDQGIIVGTARLFQDKQKIWRAGRFAVLKEYRGQGFGDLLLRMILYKAEQLAVTELYVNAQRHVAGFYSKFGFTPHADEYLEEGQPHIPMKVYIDDVNWHTGCQK